jgi:hypothetical protein
MNVPRETWPTGEIIRALDIFRHVARLTTDSTATADFVSFTMSRVKIGGADVTDGASGLTRTFPFTALKNTAGGAAVANLATTIMVQDSLA